MFLELDWEDADSFYLISNLSGIISRKGIMTCPAYLGITMSSNSDILYRLLGNL